MTDAERARAALEALPGLENLILPYGHESGLLADHPWPCTGKDFCLMRHAQKCADTIRAALSLMAQEYVVGVDPGTVPPTIAVMPIEPPAPTQPAQPVERIKCPKCGADIPSTPR